MPGGRLVLKFGRERRIKKGHLWVFSTDVHAYPEGAADGDEVSIYSKKGDFIARGFLNRRSGIVARIFSWKDEEFTKEFLSKRINRAVQLRESCGISLKCARIVFSEGDFLPGVIVDRYAGVVVVQFTTLAMDMRRGMVIDAVKSLFEPAVIYERSDVAPRGLEGLDDRKGLVCGELPRQLVVEENGLRFAVDVIEGHKTGMYLDQKLNRKAVMNLVDGGFVLDLFCYNAGFGIHALAGGAERLVAVDSSEKMLELARLNARLNGYEGRCDFVAGNCFDILRGMEKKGGSFRLVCLDPPAFAPTRESVPRALAGYKELNLRALKLVEEGGYMVTSCCSYHVSRDAFLDVVSDAAADARRRVQVIKELTQSPDHPFLAGHPETKYLKCFVLRVWRD